jgi:hypothetical protein
MMKFSQAISQVKWLGGEKTNILKTISVLVLRVLVWLVFETLVFSPLNHLTWLIARENSIILSRQEGNKSHVINLYREEMYHDTRHLEKYNLYFTRNLIKLYQLLEKNT